MSNCTTCNKPHSECGCPVNGKPKYDREHPVAVKVLGSGTGVHDDVRARLFSDMERYSSGSICCGYSLGTFQFEGKECSLAYGGRGIVVQVRGRSWEIPLDAVISMAIEADNVREEGIAAASSWILWDKDRKVFE